MFFMFQLQPFVHLKKFSEMQNFKKLNPEKL